MLTFLIILILIGALLQFISLRDGLNHIDFTYRASVKESEPGVPFTIEAEIVNTHIIPVSYLGIELQLPKSFEIVPPSASSDSVGTQLKEDSFYNVLRLSTFLKMHQKVNLSVPVSSAKRGLHHLTGALLSRGDFLGLYEVSRRYDAHSSILIYPEPMNDAGLMDTLGSLYGDMVAQQFLIRDPILTSNCREYTGQEPMHTISWIQTARTGQLMVREFEPTRDLTCSIILYHQGIDRTNEYILDTCCSLARTTGEYLIDRGISINFFTNSAMSGFAKNSVRHISAGRDNRRDYLAMLAALLVHSAGDMASLEDLALNSSDESNAYIIIAPNMSSNLMDLMDHIKRRGNSEISVLLAEDYYASEAQNEATKIHRSVMSQNIDVEVPHAG